MKLSRGSSHQRSLLYADIQALHEYRLMDIGSDVVMEQIGRGRKLRDCNFTHVIRVFLAALD